MDKQQWQDYLDGLFPNGVKVTMIEDVVEDMSDSISILTPGLDVMNVEGDAVDILCFPTAFELDIRFRILRMEPYGKGWLIHTPKEDPYPSRDYFLSTNFDTATGAALRRLRVDNNAYFGRQCAEQA